MSAKVLDENFHNEDPDSGLTTIQTDIPSQNAEHQVVSKTKLKKLARRQRYLEALPAKRKLEKERRKARRRAQVEETGSSGIRSVVPIKTFKLISESTNKFKVVVDMDFENYMTDDEIAKSIKQLGRIYSLNRRSENPCQLYFTSVKGKILDKLKCYQGYQNWDVNMTHLDYASVFTDQKTTSDNSDRKKFIYLSGDAEENLPEVDELLNDESQIFILGGLVDHNRHKNLCYERAIAKNIKTAKLPIKENINLCQRHILSTVTVFEILLHVLSSRKDWKDALSLAIPKRKIAKEENEISGIEVQQNSKS